ncbi:unnamed protein product [Medioppia subpectinata]|uniref:Uncharacterized protein n=1 Tax=Medioppia subpectinata TaxID=1979941 RepID=A0A7R9KF15_9ACAR|nr:unnamed protein product [Medioppia subpectinata]CAG2102357.1 unnamed protein product [Medioppia subpectinata]
MAIRVARFLRFVSLLRLEPYIVLFTAFYFVKRNALDVLIQDKICVHKYNMPEDFCYHLASIKKNDTNAHIKTDILADAVMYNTYQQLLTQPLSIIWSLFLGTWVDKYPKGRKWIFIIAAVTQAMEAAINACNSYFFSLNVNWVLLALVPYILSGASTFTTMYSYVGATTPSKWKTTRMTILEMCQALAQPLGVFVGGQMINLTPVLGNGQVHNYGLIFFVSSCGMIGAFLWTAFFIDQQQNKQNFEKYFGDNNVENKPEISPKSVEIPGEKSDENSGAIINDETVDLPVADRAKHPIRLLLDYKNIVVIIMSCFKRRHNRATTKIWLVIIANFCLYMIRTGNSTFLFQFVEKIYHWDAKEYSQFQSMSLAINSISVILMTYVFIKILKLHDMWLAIIGFTSVLLQNLVLAIILNPTGYYISMGVNCMNSLGSIGYKSYLSKVTEPSALGKVFTMMSFVDGFAPMIASPLFALMFRKTIDSAPSTCFAIVATLAAIPIVIALGINYLSKVPTGANPTEPAIIEQNVEPVPTLHTNGKLSGDNYNGVRNINSISSLKSNQD